MTIFSWLKNTWDKMIGNTRIPWHLVVLVMDNINFDEKVSIPLKEVRRFLQLQSKFDLKLTFITFNDPHPYSGPFGAEQKYFLHWPEIPQKWRDLIPNECDAVLVLYKLNGRAPLQLGSTFALAQGIPIHGKLRPYSSIPTDPYPNPNGEDDYYNNQPYQGFTCRSGQICTHEINNAIRAKVEVGPYLCAMTTAQDGLPSWQYESQRIRLQDACYAALGRNDD